MASTAAATRAARHPRHARASRAGTRTAGDQKCRVGTGGSSGARHPGARLKSRHGTCISISSIHVAQIIMRGVGAA